MCSSPKSSGSVRKSRVKGVFEDMDPSTRASFVAKANAAQERRSELKSAAAKRSQMNASKSHSKKALAKNKPPIKENILLSFLQRMGYAV
ncbi:hypothetical protein [Paraglaciecola sp. MB-3u-78]|jgi:hypothetical protein|uniref:hypothetical protein n=1 Tax=Paraglaciecola sp. MB-3u-78 TaxID=2058332 RepID=UPI000C32C885|nr:hypothetical protein [Paraglaciecola sp. MB-3u-78]PKG92942.1 hypothetical protein CXF95_28680 [Paraglaciecola sp. MB-3u-78]